MRTEIVLVALLMLTAGCVGSTTDAPAEEASSDPGSETQPSETETRTKTLGYELHVGPNVSTGDRVGGFGSARLGAGLTAIEVQMVWSQPSNRFGLETERPDGTEHRIDPPQAGDGQAVEAEIPETGPGPYTFHAVAPEGPVAEDTIRLEVEATFEASAEASASASGASVQTERTSEGWRAEITYQDDGSAQQAMDVRADTVNGAIGLASDADGEARAVVEAFAHGDTEDEAIERVREIRVTVRVDAGQITARAELPDDEKWEDRGAHADVHVPGSTTLSGVADTTNGPIQLDDVQASGIQFDTTNGPIQGTLSGQGDIEADTTNGPVDVDFTPTGSTDLTADTTNGPVLLGLTESSEIAYEIDADTTNGQISEAMEEAHLEREDEGEATLVTENGDTRPIQVTGLADTTNGDIRFEGR